MPKLEQILRNIHAEHYETTDKGFGQLFADVFKDKHRYNPQRKDFMLYDGKRWVNDTEGLAAKADAKALSDALIRYAVSVDKQGKYLKAVMPLCNIRNRNNMLQDSKDVYYFNNEVLDQNDYVLNVQNGTLDLSENKPKFMKHSPDMLLSKICNADYNPDATCEQWENFLLEALENDTEKIQYLQKIAGLSLTGNTQEETCFILYGKSTRNGKSTFCETLNFLLGNYAVAMRAESLAAKQNVDSRTANGDIARLVGCRLCNAPEPEKRMIFDTALLKQLLGRDSITCRELYQREFSFIPKFKLIINTNYLPVVTDDTVFSSGRINVISFNRHFSENEQDKNLKDRLKSPKELSGILNWCIRGLQLYRKEGLTPPRVVQDDTATYRSDSDKVGSFLNECFSKTGHNTSAKEAYEIYAKWCNENGYGCENKGNFFAELKAKSIFASSGTINGRTVRNILKGYTPDFVPIDSDSDTPFP
nr:MAG: D5 N terminal like protein [Bacteriophage sp.]UWD54645.1 MAG: D5 N terminal like protein [Bacteriophage sp.]UWF86772.1 MAG: D5 N terminal like protein [Bacteriophage sp.]